MSFNLRTALGLEEHGIDVDINIGNTDGQSGVDHPMVSAVSSSGMMTPEAAEVEVQESAAEAETAESEIEQIEEDVSALESYASILERSLEHHGINVISAEMMNTGLNRILNKYNVNAEEIVPSLEDYSSNAYATTRASMETVRETMSSLKEGAVEALKKFWDAIVNFFRNIAIKLIPSVKMRIKLLKKHNESYKPEGGVKLNFTGKTANILSGMKGRVLGEVEQFKKDAQDTAAQLQKISKALEDSIDKPISIDFISKEMDKLTNTGLLVGGNGESKHGSKTEYRSYTKYGNGLNTVEYPEVPDPNNISGVTISFNKPDNSKKPIEELEVNSLEYRDIDAILSVVLTLLNNIEQTSKLLTTRSKLGNWLKSLSKDDLAKANNAVLTKYIKAVNTGFREMSSYVLDVVKAVVELCAKSVKATDKKSDEDDKK